MKGCAILDDETVRAWWIFEIYEENPGAVHGE
jgi:hypothetical protein